MAKATLMVRFKRPTDDTWIRKPAVKGGNGRWLAGQALFKDKKTGEISVQEVGENYTFEVRLEDGGTTYKPVGRAADEAGNRFLEMANKASGRTAAEKVGLVVIDPESPEAKRTKLEHAFDIYIADAKKRNALEAREQALRVKKEFLEAVNVKFVDEVGRDRILDFDGALRKKGNSERTIANKRQRLQSMLTFAGIEPKIYPPKPKYEKKLPTIYSREELAAMFEVANPYQAMVCKLALKLGLRDQEVKFGEFTDIIWSESVYRVRSKPKFNFTVKDYEQRDIPIPTDFLDELKIWKENRPNQNLIVPTKTGRPNGKLLKMVKRLARRAKIECGWCPNCIAGVKGECGCDEFELHKFRRTCITTWLRNKIDPRTVMAYAGHADLETTLRYLRPAAAQERIAEVSEIKWY